MNILNSKAKSYIDTLTANGRISFTTRDLQTAMKSTYKAVERSIYRLKRKGEIATPAKGYYLILTPEFRKLGCLPPDYFIDDLMRYWQQSYYVGLLSAALFLGAAHQQPQIFQVVTNQYHKPIRCGHVRIDFITKKSFTNTPIKKLKTHTGTMNISTPETTMRDLINYIRRSGGISHVATIIDELAESVDPSHLKNLIVATQEMTWTQRLGFLLDYLGHNKLADTLHPFLKREKVNIVPLVPYSKMTNTKRNKKWRVAVNAVIESDTNNIN